MRALERTTHPTEHLHSPWPNLHHLQPPSKRTRQIFLLKLIQRVLCALKGRGRVSGCVQSFARLHHLPLSECHRMHTQTHARTRAHALTRVSHTPRRWGMSMDEQKALVEPPTEYGFIQQLNMTFAHDEYVRERER